MPLDRRQVCSAATPVPGDELEVQELIVTLKLAERLEAHAAELEYRWQTIGVPPKPRY